MPLPPYGEDMPSRIDARTLGLVVVGGMVGVAARSALVVPLGAGIHPMVVPTVTLAINVVGSFLLGLVVGRIDDRRPRLRAFLVTGVLGGFTTYSAFAVQVVDVGGAAPVVGLILAAVSVFGGVLAAAIGLRVGGGPDARQEAVAPEAAE